MQLEFLRRFNLNAYDLKALEYLLASGTASAAAIAKEADVPTSKIYSSLQKLEELGLVFLENSSPKRYTIVENDQLVQAVARLEQASVNEFNQALRQLATDVVSLSSKRIQSQQGVSIARNQAEYIDKHLERLKSAKQNIYTYWLTSANEPTFLDHTYLPLFFGNDRKLQHMILSDKSVSAAHPLERLIELRMTQSNTGGNFHLWDGKYILLVIGNSLTGIKGSMLIQDSELYSQMVEGFMNIWYAAEIAL